MMNQIRSKKRQAILETAVQVFREVGFHNASMNVIASRVGGSKSTLYNHFPSKEALLLEIIRHVARLQNQERSAILTDAAQNYINAAFLALNEPPDDVRATLLRFGENFISFLYMPELLAIRRFLVAESRQSEIGRIYYESGPKKALAQIAAYLKKAMEAGTLHKKDPLIAAAHLRSLLEAECYEYFLLDMEKPLPAKRIQEMVEAAVTVFMAAYGT